MDKLWAPWRMKYIREGIDKPQNGCIFCAKPRETEDKRNLILYRGKNAYVICNAFPYTNGHLLVVPYAHTSDLDDLDEATTLEVWKLVALCRGVLIKAFSPDGFNIGMNLGRVEGAGIDTHLHVHIVPRWNGDVNFMPVIGETKVISQSLQDTYEALKDGFGAIPPAASSCKAAQRKKARR
jgi:ATP adenylyltransferase